jgi:2-succinyl-5-enolpyruvyl-6-hydroxy-3-cyclohexene-1-carboxylate synthase
MLILADPSDTLERLVAAIERRAGQGASPARSGGDIRDETRDKQADWAARFVAGNELVWRCVEQLSDVPDRPMSEARAVQAGVRAVPAGALLALGNSLPIRTVDIYCPSRGIAVDVMSQRGANGIDGLIASVSGAARAVHAGARGRAVALILGDVSFTHDLGGLACAAQSRGPLCIVVIDNGGGRIFAQLPIAQADYGVNQTLYRDHWLTPPSCNMEAAAATYGVAYRCVRSPGELSAAVNAACGQPGCTLVHAIVDPDSAARERRRLGAAVDAGIADVLSGSGRGSDEPAADAPPANPVGDS